jgi:hypothetical protein
MFHVLTLALYLLAAVALIAGVVWALFGSKHFACSGTMFGHAARRTLEQCVGANRYAADIMFGTADRSSAAQGGWALIDRTSRARRAVRLDVR